MAREREEDDNDDDDTPHPALRNHSRIGSQVKTVLMSALKWAVIGAIALTAVGFLASLVFGGTIGAALGTLIPIPGLGTLFGASLGTAAGGALFGWLGGASTTVMYGAAAGGIIGGLTGLAGASEVADNEEDRLISKYEQNQARGERLARLREARDRRQMEMEEQMTVRAPTPRRGLPRGGRQEGPAYG